MAKKPVVKFFLEDAPKPSKISGINGTSGIELRCPTDTILIPGLPVTIKLGLRCDLAVLVGSTKINLDKVFFLPGEDLTVIGIPTVKERTPISAGERIAVCVPQFNVDYDIE